MESGKSKKYIIALTSGLGNQIFQYALAQYLISKGHIVRIYPFKKFLNEHNGLELERIFINIKIPKKYLFLFDLLVSFIYGYRIHLDSILTFYFPFLKKKLSSIYHNLIGWELIIFPSWSNYTFLNDIPNLLEIFKFPSLDIKNQNVVEEMNKSNSVSIHIRRGDYQTEKKWKFILGDVCDINYYKNAIEEICKYVQEPKYYIFSDDIGWAKTHLKNIEATYVDWNVNENSYKDIVLMANCKFNICANSTFSLVGTWLNINNNVVRIVPSKWENTYDNSAFKKYVPRDDSWIVINNSFPKVSIVYSPLSVSSFESDIQKIFNQTYTDFEVIVKGCKIDYDLNFDSRLKNDRTPSGLYILYFDNLHPFDDINYLKKKVWSLL